MSLSEGKTQTSDSSPLEEVKELSSSEKIREALAYSYGVGKVFQAIDVLIRQQSVEPNTAKLVMIRQDLTRVGHEMADKISGLVEGMSVEDRNTYNLLAKRKEEWEADALDEERAMIVSGNPSQKTVKKLELATDSNTLLFIVNNFAPEGTKLRGDVSPVPLATDAYAFVNEMHANLIKEENATSREMSPEERQEFARLGRRMWDIRIQGQDKLSVLAKEKLGLTFYFFLPPFPDYEQVDEENEATVPG